MGKNKTAHKKREIPRLLNIGKIASCTEQQQNGEGEREEGERGREREKGVQVGNGE